MKLTLSEILKKHADYFLQTEEKSSHNGPYFDEETLVRSASHKSILFWKVYNLTQDQKYKVAAIKEVEKLYQEDFRPYNKTFYCRKKKSKDKCNGLVGQAWAIEALMVAYRETKKEKYRFLAKEVFDLLEFNSVLGFWRKREITGKKLFFDFTFNHQLWLAAAGSFFKSQESLIFLDKIKKNLYLYPNGLIKHLIFSPLTKSILHLKKFSKLTDFKKKEISYFGFNLYALGLMKQNFPDHSFWSSKKFKMIKAYAVTKEHLDVAEKSKYGFAYNPSGIELAFFIDAFNLNGLLWLKKEALERQFNRNLNRKTLIMDQNTLDPVVLTLRIYEATRIKDLELDIFD